MNRKKDISSITIDWETREYILKVLNCCLNNGNGKENLRINLGNILN